MSYSLYLLQFKKKDVVGMDFKNQTMLQINK